MNEIAGSASARYWLHQGLHRAKLPPYRRKCERCGERAFSFVITREGKRLCLKCYRGGER